MSNIGQFIKEKRKSVGLSQKELGTVCHLSDSEIMRIENGVRKKPNWENLCKIAHALGFHPFEFLLVANYISENDIHPSLRLRGLDALNSKDIECLQLFVDFMIYIKNKNGSVEGGGKNAI